MNAASRPSRLAIVLAFAALYLIWGSTYLGIRFAIASIPPLLMAGTRFFLAGVIMYAIARTQGAKSSSLGEWGHAIVIGACLLLCGNGGVSVAEQWVASGLASLLVATVPIDIALLSWVTGMAPRPQPLVFLGLAGGFVGVGILVGPALMTRSNNSRPQAIGMLLLLFASFMWSAGSLYSRRVKNAVSPFLSSAQTMLCGGALMFLAGLTSGEESRFFVRQVTLLSLGAFVYLVLIGAVVGYTAYIFLLRHCEPSKVATYAYVNPVVAVLLGAFFAGEKLSGRTLLASALIVGSVALVITAQPRSKKIATVAQTNPMRLKA